MTRICFGILSSSTDGAIVAQLIKALGEDDAIVVHHDFSQTPGFSVETAGNVTVMADYVRTDWGGWAQARAILHLIEHALKHETFDYFQLLSETCLPVRPLSDFRTFLDEAQPDACIGLIPLDLKTDDLGTLNYGWRYLFKRRLLKRVFARLARPLLSPSAVASPGERPLVQGLSVIPVAQEGGGLRRAVSKVLLGLILKVVPRMTPFSKDYRCHVGSTWLCMSRRAAEHLVKAFAEHPSLQAQYRHARSPDESVIHTLLGNAGFARLYPPNHFLSWRERESGPDELVLAHLGEVQSSGKFFARKFSKLPDDPCRRQVLGGEYRLPVADWSTRS